LQGRRAAHSGVAVFAVTAWSVAKRAVASGESKTTTLVSVAGIKPWAAALPSATTAARCVCMPSAWAKSPFKLFTR
jgi:hypothetical protein